MLGSRLPSVLELHLQLDGKPEKASRDEIIRAKTGAGQHFGPVVQGEAWEERKSIFVQQRPKGYTNVAKVHLLMNIDIGQLNAKTFPFR